MALKTITGKVTDPAGVVGVPLPVISINLNISASITGTQEIINSAVLPVIASDGTYSVQLQANSDLTPAGTFYTVTEYRASGAIYQFTVVVPGTAGPFIMSNLLTPPPAPPPVNGHVSSLVVDGSPGISVNAAGDIGARSLSLSANSPYTSLANASFAIGSRQVWLVPPNGVDDTSVLQAAQAALVTAGGGTLVFQPGIYKISGSLTPATSCTWRGAYGNATVIQWVGAINSFMITMAPASGSNVQNFNLEGFVIDANNISGVVPCLFNSMQHSRVRDILIQNVTGSGTVALRLEATAGTSATNNSNGNVFENIYIKNAPVGVQFAGQLGGSTNTYSTNNRFYGLYLETITEIGIRFVQWCDSNAFFGTEIALGANNAVGIKLNDSATPAADTGVYNCNFYHLSIDSFGITGATGVYMNTTKQLMINGLYFSPVVFNGTPVLDNAGRALSYDLVILQDTNSTNNIVRYSKNFIIDSAGGSGLGTYANYLTQSSVVTGNAPTLAAVGSDAIVNMQLNTQSTGSHYRSAGGTVLEQLSGSTGFLVQYGKGAVQGTGVPAIMQAPVPLTAQTAAVASVATLTSPNDGVKHTYDVTGFVTITTLGSGSFNLQVAYTDSNGTARTCNIPLAAQAGTFAALANTADDYKGCLEITVNPNTAVTIKTAGTFTGCTYNVGGNVKRVL